MRLGYVLIVLSIVTKVFTFEEDNSTETEAPEAIAVSPLDNVPSNQSVAEDTVEPSGSPRPPRGTRPSRRRSRRGRGFYNDFRYRNPSNNPYNPNSPYAFRGRPGQPPVQQPPVQQQPPPGYYADPRYRGYDGQYYDPYSQTYYGYPGYYPYPYPPQPPPPLPTLPPTESIPELYYVEKHNSPGGQYQYKKVSVVQEFRDRPRRRPTRWPQQAYPQPVQGYYNYPYSPYDNRRPPPPSYYQSYQYPDQSYQYNYPKYHRSPRSRFRGAISAVRSTFVPERLTFAPKSVFGVDHTTPGVTVTLQPTEASGD